MKTPPEPQVTLPAAAPLLRPAISPARDRLQSELLVWGWMVTVLPLALLILCVQTSIAWENGTLLSSMRMHGVYVSVLLALLVLVLRAATPAAAAVGGVICFTMTLEILLTSSKMSETALPTLIMLVILTLTATRIGRARKAELGLAEKKRGRSISQIVANLGMASAVSLLHGMHAAAGPACIAVLAEATADTVSSELGPLLPGRTFLITTLCPVTPGTDGGISLGGSLCGLAAAAAVIYTGITTMQMDWLEAKIAIPGVLLGFLADSFLGATLERRGKIGNDVVNFLSTAIAAMVAFALGVWLIP